jgi:vitamin B12 transporter
MGVDPREAAAAVMVIGFVAMGMAVPTAVIADPDSTSHHLPGLTISERRPVWGSQTTLSRTWLTKRDPVDLVHALQFVPGVQVKQTTAGASLSFRGFGAQRVAVLWDGRPLNPEQGGGVDLWSLNLEAVDRVDITRGAAGARYGPHAVSGAINLVPKRGFGNSLSLRALGGTGGRLRLSGAGGTTQGAWELRGSAFTDSRDVQRFDLPSGYHGWGGNVDIGRSSDAASLDFTASVGADKRDIPGTIQFPTPSATLSNDSYMAAARTDISMDKSSNVLFDLSWLHRQRQYMDPTNPFGAVEDQHKNQRLALHTAWEAEEARIFAEGAADRLESSTDGDQSRDRGAFGVEAQRSLKNLMVSGILRLDAIEHFKPEATWRVSAAVPLESDWEIRGSGGTAFRAPTFDDLFWPARASASGNPDLQPEYAWDVEVGLTRRGPLNFDLSGFYSQLTDMIVWSPGPGGIWRPYNVGKARVAGIEASSRATFELGPVPSEINAAFTWLDARNINGNPLTDGTRLPGRPPYRVLLEAAVSPGAWRAGVGTEAVGAIPLTPGETKQQDAYALLNAHLRRRLSDSWWVDIEGQNLTDAYYEDIRGYPTPGIQLLLGVRFRGGA